MGIEPLPRDGVRKRRDGVAPGQDQILDGSPVALGILGLQEGRHAGDVGRGHRGPAEDLVRVPRGRAEDLTPGSAQMNGAPPEVRERGPRVGPRRGGHGDDVGEREASGIRRRGVVVGPSVPGGSDEQDSALLVSLDGVEQRLRKPAAAPAVVRRDDIDPSLLHELDVLKTVDRIGDVAGARRIQKLARHEANRSVDPDDADAVVPDGANRAGDMGAVVIVVHGVGIVVGGVDSEAVVDLTVAVVIDPVVVAVRRVTEHVRGQVRVGVVDSRVDHGHDDVAAPGREVPGFGGIDVRVREPTGLAHVAQSPEIAETWVAGSRLDFDDPVRLRIDDIGKLPVEGDGFLDLHPDWNSHRVKAFDDREVLVRSGAHERVSERLGSGQGRCLEPHENGVGSVAWRRLGEGTGLREEQRKQEEDPEERHRVRSAHGPASAGR